MGGSQVTPESVFLLVTAVAGAVMATVFSLHGRNRHANRFLASLILCVALIVLDHALLRTRIAISIPAVPGFSWPLWFLVGPLFYLYVGRLTRARGSHGGTLVHFFPALLTTAYLIPFYRLSSTDKASYIDAVFATGPLEPGILAVMLLRIAHMGFYVYLTTVALRDFTGEFKLRSASDEITSLELFRWITIPFVAYLGLTSVDLLLMYVHQDKWMLLQYVDVMALSGFIVVLCYVGLRQSDAAFEPDYLYPEKYRKARLDDGQASVYIDDLTQLMEGEHLYLNGALRLYDLASRLGVSTHNLSQLLNQSLNTNFYDFVNQYRVEHAKRRLRDPDSREYTLASIANEVGFSSKASFNRAFKKLTGMTPSQFKDAAGTGDDRRGGEAALS